MIEQFDVNQDGTITQVEIDQVRRDRLAAYDQNNDGSLTLEEYQALWLDAMRERMVDRFQDLDDEGDAIVTVEEFVEPFGSMVGRLDRNGDGALSRDDMRRGPHHRAPDDEDDEDD
jgi:Ca2+-binding EF-hand superfamily protein